MGESDAGIVSALLLGGHFLLVVVLAIRVLHRRLPVGTTLAWLLVLFSVPVAGPAVYLFIGENRLGQARGRQWRAIHALHQDWLARLHSRAAVDWSRTHPRAPAVARHAESVTGFPALQGHALTLLPDWDRFMDALIADIEAATRSCHLAFYIWESAGRTGELYSALARAAARGVRCRVLVDAVGSGDFLASDEAEGLRKSGVQVVASLPVGLLRMALVRMDLRNHRKIVVVDGVVGYTGSMNLADPRYFKAEAGVGRWVDAMLRLRGPAVEVLNGTFMQDWELETSEGMAVLDTADIREVPEAGDAIVQVVPSGPGLNRPSIHQFLLGLLYAAETELVLTTPYFVPDEPMLTALESAARRGVTVILVLPERLDSKLARFAGQACFDGLLEAGVQIWRYEPDLLHTKTITVDRRLAIIGSVNLDMRSLWLNFEISLAVYDPDTARQIRQLQSGYLAESVRLHPEAWGRRPRTERMAEGVLRLLGPLL